MWLVFHFCVVTSALLKEVIVEHITHGLWSCDFCCHGGHLEDFWAMFTISNYVSALLERKLLHPIFNFTDELRRFLRKMIYFK